MIDTAFFRTKQFVIAAVVAVFILGAAAAAYTVGGVSEGFSRHEGCTATVEGTPLASEPVVLVESGGLRKTVTYTMDASDLAGGSLVACSVVGTVLVEPSADAAARIEFRIEAESPEAVEATDVRASFTRLGSGVGVAAWHEALGESSNLFGRRSAEVTTVIHLPATGAYDVRLRSDVGDLTVADLLVGELLLSSDVGELRASDVDVEGNVSARSDVGDIILALRSVQSATFDVSSDVGDIDLRLPPRADVGYDVTAASDVGEIDVRLGDTETYTSESEGPGGQVAARSRGYDSKPTQVMVTALSDVGSIRIVAT